MKKFQLKRQTGLSPQRLARVELNRLVPEVAQLGQRFGSPVGGRHERPGRQRFCFASHLLEIKRAGSGPTESKADRELSPKDFGSHSNTCLVRAKELQRPFL